MPRGPRQWQISGRPAPGGLTQESPADELDFPADELDFPADEHEFFVRVASFFGREAPFGAVGDGVAGALSSEPPG